MSAAKHTPGPWEVSPQARVPGIEGEDTARSVVFRPSPQVTWVLAEWCKPADACLIAAAPELLEALENCIDTIEADMGSFGDDQGIRSSRIRAARAAIAKATGGQP